MNKHLKKIIFLFLLTLTTSSCSLLPIYGSSSSEVSSSELGSETNSSEEQGSEILSSSEELSSEPTSSNEESSEIPEVVEGLNESDNHRTYYQLLVYSFADSNNDGIGDFKGIIDKLDYLYNLGIEGLWLSPVLKASSYHSYDVEDYYTINPDYEVTLNDVKYDINVLLEECHKRNIKVLMDLVINHTSSRHIWRNQHSDWYGNDNRFGFPEFNYDKTAVREAVKEVGRYWLNRGFDGFRLDAAMWIYNSGNNRHEKNFEFWQEWCNAMKQTKPNCYIIGEVLDDNHDLAYEYAKAGFDSTFDFNTLGNVIINIKNNTKDYATKISGDASKATNINENYILARALSNHDIGRFNQEHPDSSDKAYYVEDINQIKLANSLNVLTPGNAFIYYGDELGLKGTCEDTKPNWYYDMNYRTPMPWKSGTTRSVQYFKNFHGTGITTSSTYSMKTADEDMNNVNSIYNTLKEAIEIKNTNEILQKGKVSKIIDLQNNLNGFEASFNNQKIRIVFSTNTNVNNFEIQGTLLYKLNCEINNRFANFSNYGLLAYKI